MSLNCPNCSSENTQLLSIAYGSGVHTGKAMTRKARTSRHIHTTVSINQSELSRQAEPPKKFPVGFPIKSGAISAVIIAVVLTWLLPDRTITAVLIWGISLCIGIFSIYMAYRGFMYNRTDWVAKMETWKRQYVCLRCGTVYEPVVSCGQG